MVDNKRYKMEGNPIFITDYDIPKISFKSSIIFILVSFLSISLSRHYVSDRLILLLVNPIFISFLTVILESVITQNVDIERKKIALKVLAYFVIIFIYLLIVLF